MKKKMKTTRFLCLTLACAMLVSSCKSSYQAAGGVTGAMIGSHVGGTVGYLSGGHGRHFRGQNSALGSLIGMGVGAMLGVGIASQIEGKEKAEARRYNERYDQSTNQTSDREGYYGNQDYQIGGGSYNDRTETRQNSTSAYAATLGTSIISISELTYMDSDGDGSITKGETIEVESFVTNTTNSVLRDVVISLNVSDSKACSFSPSLTTTLQPGQKIRYTGRIHCNRRPRGNTSIGVNLSTLYSGKTCSSNNLYVKVR